MFDGLSPPQAVLHSDWTIVLSPCYVKVPVFHILVKTQPATLC